MGLGQSKCQSAVPTMMSDLSRILIHGMTLSSGVRCGHTSHIRLCKVQWSSRTIFEHTVLLDHIRGNCNVTSSPSLWNIIPEFLDYMEMKWFVSNMCIMLIIFNRMKCSYGMCASGNGTLLCSKKMKWKWTKYIDCVEYISGITVSFHSLIAFYRLEKFRHFSSQKRHLQNKIW